MTNEAFENKMSEHQELMHQAIQAQFTTLGKEMIEMVKKAMAQGPKEKDEEEFEITIADMAAKHAIELLESQDVFMKLCETDKNKHDNVCTTENQDRGRSLVLSMERPDLSWDKSMID